MKINNISLAALFLLSLSVLSACASSTGHRVAVQGEAITQSPPIGISKGQIPPDFTITTIDGKQLSLREFKNENKPVLLYFWASWCPYCSKDFDVVKNVYQKYADKVTFLAIDLDLSEDSELIRSYTHSHN